MSVPAGAVAQSVSFAPEVAYALPSDDNANRVATGPLAAGGPDDIVTGDTNGNVTVFLNRGDGTFAPGVDYQTGGGTVTGIAIADVNGDGKEDVVATTEGPGSSGIFIFLGDGKGGLAAPYSVPNYDGGSGDSPTALAVGDFFHDGRVALATGAAHREQIPTTFGSSPMTEPAASHSPTRSESATPTPAPPGSRAPI